MELEDAKDKFIQSWGVLGSNWGVNRTMAQIHALLLISPDPLCADDIMEALKISRGNANMNIRALIDWGLVYKELLVGERKEFFVAEKDIWDVVRKITAQRKKKELDPVIKTLEELSKVEDSGMEAEAFRKVIGDINAVSTKAEKALDALSKADDNWMTRFLLKMLG
jgi:DNA-binding transcriptional regulator GbsR (MarR family)